MNMPTELLPASHIPRMTDPVPFKVQCFNGVNQLTQLPIILLIIESANGTFAFHMPPDYASGQFIPALDAAVINAGGKSVLGGSNGLIVANTDDLRNIERRGQ